MPIRFKQKEKEPGSVIYFVWIMRVWFLQSSQNIDFSLVLHVLSLVQKKKKSIGVLKKQHTRM